MRVKKYRIVVDVDSTLNNLMPVWTKVYNAMYNTSIDWTNQIDYDLNGLVLPEEKEAFLDILHHKGLFRSLLPLPRSQESLKSLHREGHDIWIATICRSSSIIQEKKEWLLEHYPFLNENNFVYLSGNSKSILDADIMIEDNPKYIEEFLENSSDRKAFCIEQPYNRHHSFDENLCKRISDWSIFLKTFNDFVLH